MTYIYQSLTRADINFYAKLVEIIATRYHDRMILLYETTSIDVPAWIQAGAAVFAAVGLVWTLFLQKKATDAQVRATEDQLKVNQAALEIATRDYRRYVKEIAPVVKVDIHLSDEHLFDGLVDFVVHENAAYQLRVSNMRSEYVETGNFNIDEPLDLIKGGTLPSAYILIKKRLILFAAVTCWPIFYLSLPIWMSLVIFMNSTHGVHAVCQKQSNLFRF